MEPGDGHDPGVIIGGQIGPRLRGKVPQHAMIRVIGVPFGIIGVAMLWLVLRGD